MMYPHVNAAHINALAEEGTREELIEWLQKQWDEICVLRKALAEAKDGTGAIPVVGQFECAPS